VAILLQDIRFAFRQLWKHPGFSLTAIFSLALGIAATVSVFSVIYSVLLHPFPYRDADHIVQYNIRAKSDFEYTPFIYREQIAQLRQARSVEDVVEMDEQFLADTTTDIPQDVDVVFLSGNAFQFFGVPAMLGRPFLPSDAPEGQAPQPVAVLTYQYWKRHFNANPAVVGQTLRVDGRAYTILGVMPRNFTWWDADIYVPLNTTGRNSFMTVVRLKPNVSKAQATAELLGIFQQMIHDHPHSILEGMTAEVISIQERFERSLGKTLYVLFAAVLLLLVIGCVNVSILLLARGSARQHEFAVRAAVGASAWRIVRLLLTESLILGLTGAVLGVIITYRSSPFVVSMLPWQLFPRGLNIPVHLPVLTFSVAIAIFTSVLFGLFPALQFARPEIREIMQTNTRKAAGSVAGKRMHAILIAGQIALAVVLLTAAVTAIQGFRQLMKTDLGYDPNRIADYSIPIHKGTYTTWEARANYFQQLRDRVAQAPGVASVSLALIGPPSSEWDFPAEILGRNNTSSQLVNVNFVSPEFFRDLRIPLLQGRIWDEAEASRGAHLAIVNKSFVKHYFPNGDVLGHSVRVPKLVSSPPGTVAVEGSDGWTQIIGVVGDARNDGLDSPVKPEVYYPYSFYMIDFLQILVRAHGDPLALESEVRRRIAEINPAQQVSYPITPLTERVEHQPEWARGRLSAVLSTAFSVLALVLASVGLYSVVSYSVAQRTNEFGIRMAMGAQRRHILQNVFSTAGISVGSGLLIGFVLSFGLHGLLAHWIEGAASNPLMILAVCLLLIAVAFLACVVPALRASMVQPMKALRVE
jgi:predicted permease